MTEKMLQHTGEIYTRSASGQQDAGVLRHPGGHQHGVGRELPLVPRFRVIETVAEMRAARAEMKEPVALVPTMGALHAGHEALVAAARQRAPTVVASLFVNPTQFGPNEDYKTYPANRERDLEIFRSGGVDVVFAPSVEEMYPGADQTRVDPGRIGGILEGERRPGHFRGVATVVTKLFVAVRPDIAMFGEKDAQQVRVIRRINEDLLLGVDIVTVPTVRDYDGLALSSRNAYLDPDQRRAAPVLYNALREAALAWESGERGAEALRQSMRRVLDAQPLASTDYAEIVDPVTLERVDRFGESALALLAVRIGWARLIDNMLLS